MIGYSLPRTYWVLHNYYVDDYWDYGLAPPPDGFEWIRYGPDLLLVDLATGDISQAIYGAFDVLLGGGGNDVIKAGSGTTYIDGGAGTNTITLGAGNDILQA